ncbi:hypothetical protein CRUP_038469 [Coryphaenoides rupestris]|nr:hypothetical protein CRUP_038469 [Coryphaenoides rupestris]
MKKQEDDDGGDDGGGGGEEAGVTLNWYAGDDFSASWGSRKLQAGSQLRGQLFCFPDVEEVVGGGGRSRQGQDSPIACSDNIHLYDNQSSPGTDADDSGCVLLNTSRRYVTLMNFKEEVRAHRDLDGFLARASILLDETAASLDDVLKRMLHHVGQDPHTAEPGCNFEEVMSMLFTDAGAQEVNGEESTQTGNGHSCHVGGVSGPGF